MKIQNRQIKIAAIIILIIAAISFESCKGKNTPTQPWVLAPVIKIQNPSGYPYNIVGQGTILTVTGQAWSIETISAIVDGRTVASAVNSAKIWKWDFHLDINNDFSTPGRKNIIIRGLNQGESTDVTLEIINDENELRNQAIQFIHSDWIKAPDGGLARLIKTNVYVINENFPEIQNIIIAALGYMEEWTRLHFIFVHHENVTPIIIMRKVPEAVLGTSPTPIPAITQVLIRIGDRFIIFGYAYNVKSLCHEMGHAIGIAGHPHDGSIMETSTPNIDPPIFHPYQQKAVTIVYSMPPGSKI